ncbi:MAG TPA: GspH/FimT family pseudopilin [Acidobacteriota bacterium]|nr:GspH/FimT family pseudopilin [Acidobacteriota bacterium]
MRERLSRGARSNKGFSLIETLIVIAIIGVLVAISVPALGRYFQEYRLNAAAREIKSSIQFARLKAVTSNFNVTFTYNIGGSGTPDTYQVTGSENVNGGSLDPWEDLNGNGVADGLADANDDPSDGAERPTLYQEDKRVIYGNFGTTGVSTLPTGSSDLSPTSPIQITFTSKGNFSSTYAGNCISLQNTMNMVQAVCVYPGGYTRLFKRQDSGSWLEVF